MKKTFHTSLRLACALACAAALAACSASAPSQPSLPAAVPSTPGDPIQSVNFHGGGISIRNDDSLTLPLDAYDSPRNWQKAENAINALAQECMRRKAFNTPPDFLLTAAPHLAVSTLYGVVDLIGAEQNGYRSFTGTTAPAGQTTKPDASAAKAFFGDPHHGDGGCRGVADGKIGMQEAYDAFALVQKLRAEARAAAWHDSRVQQVNGAWSSCVKAAGYTYADPTVPPHDKNLLGRGLPKPPGAALPPPSPAEKAAAVTDVKCKRRVNYLQTVALVTAAYQNLLIAQQATPLRQGEEAWRTVVEAAGKITSAVN